MKSPMTLALAFVAAAAVGTAGYLIGSRDAYGTSVRAAAETLVAEAPASDAMQAPGAFTLAELSEAAKAEVEAIIREYLLAHPEVVRDAIYELQRKEEEEAREAQVSTIVSQAERLFSSPVDVVIGNPDGDVTLVEFFDYNCGYCRRAQADMQQLIADDPNLKVVLKEFPVLGEGSIEASQVSIAVRILAPAKAGEFHDALIAQSGQVNADIALAVAEELGLDRAMLEETMHSDEVRQTITEVYALAQSLSLTGTPSYVTAEEVAIGAIGYDALKEKIAAARENCATAVC